MGEQLNLPRINEIAAYLDKFAPSVQAALRKSAPETSELLKSGTVGGDDTSTENAVRAGLIARAKVLDAALAEAITQSQSDVSAIEQKLSRLKKMRFVSLICGAVGSSAVLAAAFTKPLAVVVAGSLALIASVTGLAAENLILGQKNSEDKLRDTGATLARVIGEGTLTRKLLVALQSIDFDPDELKTVIADANKLFGDLVAARSSLVASL
jgi:hypothetical protein